MFFGPRIVTVIGVPRNMNRWGRYIGSGLPKQQP